MDVMNNDNIPAKIVQKEGVDRYNARVWRDWREKE